MESENEKKDWIEILRAKQQNHATMKVNERAIKNKFTQLMFSPIYTHIHTSLAFSLSL